MNRKITLLISAIFVITVISGVFLLSLFIEAPVKNVTVTIPKGSGLAETAEILNQNDVISNKYIFMAYAVASGKNKNFYPGSYVFETGSSYSYIVTSLARGPKKIVYKVTVPEGFTVDQIASKMNRKTGMSQVKFMEAFEAFKTENPGLGEGYLFPDTYFFEGEAKPEYVIKAMYNQFNNETKSLKPLQGYSFKQMVIVASLVETEARRNDERGLIASVIYNRLKKGMRLEIDATVQFALPKRKEKLSRKDLFVSSPYNTYRNKGLPPGPICNPGILSLKSASNPAKSGYLYYVLTDTKSGKHFFTDNYDAFLNAKRKAK